MPGLKGNPEGAPRHIEQQISKIGPISTGENSTGRGPKTLAQMPEGGGGRRLGVIGTGRRTACPRARARRRAGEAEFAREHAEWLLGELVAEPGEAGEERAA